MPLAGLASCQCIGRLGAGGSIPEVHSHLIFNRIFDSVQHVSTSLKHAAAWQICVQDALVRRPMHVCPDFGDFEIAVDQRLRLFHGTALPGLPGDDRVIRMMLLTAESQERI